ncbi:MAG: hypothetical protein MJZ53_01980 [Paludibacteraceae bacterium]|nr:hypothetical protein [Paludibacteraceae bacterium]
MKKLFFAFSVCVVLSVTAIVIVACEGKSQTNVPAVTPDTTHEESSTRSVVGTWVYEMTGEYYEKYVAVFKRDGSCTITNTSHWYEEPIVSNGYYIYDDKESRIELILSYDDDYDYKYSITYKLKWVNNNTVFASEDDYYDYFELGPFKRQ